MQPRPQDTLKKDTPHAQNGQAASGEIGKTGEKFSPAFDFIV
jgi:hypothetical protein